MTTNTLQPPRYAKKLSMEWQEGNHGVLFAVRDGVRYEVYTPVNEHWCRMTIRREGSPAGLAVTMMHKRFKVDLHAAIALDQWSRTEAGREAISRLP